MAGKVAEDGRYNATEESDKPKYYVTGMFPYPSGAGMHTGHFFEHSIVDAVARFYRAQGRNVTYPMGWDSFGLPAENYAIKTGVAPAVATKENIANFKNQLTRVGASIDWSRELNTTDPGYYKWTQWIFTQLFERGLAYQKESLQWWCPVDKTVLANEQVEGGKCWRCGSEVEKKSMNQWFFKITEYADALLEEIPALNWPEKIKTAQTNWIGKSEGAEISFGVEPSMSKAVLLHGFTGDVESNFFPWLSSHLKKHGIDVWAENMPDTDSPDARTQANFVLDSTKLDQDSVVVAHSYGAVTALRLIEQLDHPIRKLVLAAGFAEPGFLDHERIFEKTTDWEFDFDRIRSNVDEVVFLRAENDSAVPRERADYLQSKLGGKIVDFVANDDHICGVEEPEILKALSDEITVFSTRPDTIFGATFIVLAPEYRLARGLATDDTRATVENYIDEAVKKSEIERQSEGKEKTGVFTGSYAINPASGEKVPIWIADYVLGGYGTGAVMGVPAHDERDFEFAEKFELPIVQVVASYDEYDGVHAPRNDKPTVKRATVNAIIVDEDGNYLLQIEDEQNVHFVGGGIDDADESTEAAIRREVMEETGYTDIVSIRQVAPFVSVKGYRNTKARNQVTWGAHYEVVLESKNQVRSEIDEGLHSQEWVKKAEVANRITWKHHLESWQAYLEDKIVDTDVREGLMVNSGVFDGMPSSDAREEIIAWLEQQGMGKSKTIYKMRDWLISRQRYWGAPIPIIHCDEHGAVPVPEKDLPVILPEVKDYEPKGDGKSPLARQTDWVNTTCPTCGKPAKRETDVMDGYACSSWYLLRYTDPHNDQQAWAPDKATYWTPVDMYIGGDHAVAHLLYVRFWSHVFYDMQLVPEKEPVKQLVYHGLIQAEDGRKMSKSLGNVVDPLDVIDQGYGADALRTFELFLGPINENSNWSSRGIAGVYRFLTRLWTLVQEFDESEKADIDSSKLESVVHQTIKKVSSDVHRLSFNTAIAALMECTNELYKLKTEGFSEAWRENLAKIIQLVQPFAPHMAAELWVQLGYESQLDFESWPAWDETKIVTDTIMIIVQVNGKLRAKLELAKDVSEDDVKGAALADEKVQSLLGNQKPTKVIYVPGRLVNVVI